jgi:DNA-binding CsgD family transcriptional regulator
MTRLSKADLEAITVGLQGIYAAEDPDAFPARMLAELRGLIPCDQLSYNEIDLARRRADVVLDTPEAVPPAVLQSFARYVHQHPLVAHCATTGDGRARKLSDFLTQRELHRLDIYNAVFRELATEYQMAISVSAHGSAVIGIAFNRLRPDFSERERLMLDTLAPHLVQAYRNAQTVRGQRKALLEMERQMTGPSLVELVDRLRALRLTSREAEVFGCLLKGKSNDEIADDLIVTPWTVHKHLEHIYRKLGVQSRTAAIARVFDTLQTGR